MIILQERLVNRLSNLRMANSRRKGNKVRQATLKRLLGKVRSRSRADTIKRGYIIKNVDALNPTSSDVPSFMNKVMAEVSTEIYEGNKRVNKMMHELGSRGRRTTTKSNSKKSKSKSKKSKSKKLTKAQRSASAKRGVATRKRNARSKSPKKSKKTKKLTKAQRSASAKKAVATRKRNAAKKSKSKSKKSKKSKKLTKAQRSASARRGVATRKRNAAKKSPKKSKKTKSRSKSASAKQGAKTRKRNKSKSISNRPSPSASAADKFRNDHVGYSTISKGKDRNYWIVGEGNSTGRWFKCGPKKSDCDKFSHKSWY